MRAHVQLPAAHRPHVSGRLTRDRNSLNLHTGQAYPSHGARYRPHRRRGRRGGPQHHSACNIKFGLRQQPYGPADAHFEVPDSSGDTTSGVQHLRTQRMQPGNHCMVIQDTKVPKAHRKSRTLRQRATLVPVSWMPRLTQRCTAKECSRLHSRLEMMAIEKSLFRTSFDTAEIASGFRIVMNYVKVSANGNGIGLAYDKDSVTRTLLKGFRTRWRH